MLVQLKIMLIVVGVPSVAPTAVFGVTVTFPRVSDPDEVVVQVATAARSCMGMAPSSATIASAANRPTHERGAVKAMGSAWFKFVRIVGGTQSITGWRQRR
ncbi:MAG TPA: hypothetical protein VIT62_14735 [Lysobacter sp.]